jgi:hypothetical protein
MNAWQWLISGLVGIGLVPALWLLDRLGLWLEDRGWLYYRKKKPTSSSTSAWIGMQQFIEPGVKHVVQIGQDRRSEEDETARKERILANLLASLDAMPANRAAIRFELIQANREGLDWRMLYEEAVKIQRSTRPERGNLIPPVDDVAPLESSRREQRD